MMVNYIECVKLNHKYLNNNKMYKIYAEKKLYKSNIFSYLTNYTK